ncbi:uncharacterized protein LOC117433669 isoform X2 [Acipenser ruthenus]|uniref:uncharacterized protein LOC117433669 isoform X2 n=1 Tax=Acipenser ruthenus TaxID=7906 RepID=UPI002740F61B|nr:uncharacterized protein LOC117433669 isoform X2 [Acipenser ruthenus]XP_058866668.1 uncharacterized protein LOC117433669 isoform X2 [Acipenser ruthenus]XP_058866669.1 uncharacterized protein LOC117433669 isoform X2 [Acipenser ruthenus]
MAVIDISTPAVGENAHDAKHPTEETGIPEEGISGTKTPIQESGIKEEHCVSDQLEKKDLQSPPLSTLDCLTQDEMNGSPAIQPLACTSVHSDEEHSDKAPNSPDLIADLQLEDPAQERDPALDTENTPSEEDGGALTLGSGDVPAVSCILDHGPIPTADCDDKKKETKKKNCRQEKSKAKKMKKNKPSPAIASSTHCWAITKVLEDLRPWLIGFLVFILLCIYPSADAINIPAPVCIGQTAALDLNTEGPVKGPYAVYKGIFRKSKVVYSNEIVSNCPPRPYIIPDDQSYLFCNSDNKTALLLVSNVTLEHNSKFTVEYTTQDDNPGSKETSLQVNSTECPSKMTNEDSHNDTNTQSNLGEGPNIPVLCGFVAGVVILLVALPLAGYCLIKRCRKDGEQNMTELDQVDACSRLAEDGQQAATGNGYQPIASRDAEGSAENRPVAV